jgi:hypothetical protein
MGFNSAFKGLNLPTPECEDENCVPLYSYSNWASAIKDKKEIKIWQQSQLSE